jgi:hypothetical protein
MDHGWITIITITIILGQVTTTPIRHCRTSRSTGKRSQLWSRGMICMSSSRSNIILISSMLRGFMAIKSKPIIIIRITINICKINRKYLWWSRKKVAKATITSTWTTWMTLKEKITAWIWVFTSSLNLTSLTSTRYKTCPKKSLRFMARQCRSFSSSSSRTDLLQSKKRSFKSKTTLSSFWNLLSI